MRKRWIALLLLGAMAAALAGIAYFIPHVEDRSTFPLSRLAAAEVNSIRIERRESAPTVLERKDGTWHIAAPFKAQAEQHIVERVLSILSARSPQRMAPIELRRFELEDPALTVRFDGQALDFGLVSPVTREQYVLTGGAVYLIAPRYAAMVPVDPAQFARRQLLPDGAVPTRIRFPRVTMERGADGWRMEPPRAGVTSDEIGRVADDWRLASAQRVTGGADAGRALREIAIKLENGEELVFELLQSEPELVLRRRGEQLLYAFTPAASKRLLSLTEIAP